MSMLGFRAMLLIVGWGLIITGFTTGHKEYNWMAVITLSIMLASHLVKENK